MISLDKSCSNPARRHQSHNNSDGIECKSVTNDIINRALVYAIYAYSVRWLHLTNEEPSEHPETRHNHLTLKKDLSDNLWTQARKRMYAVMSRPSYRSILALYLFAIIPSSSRKGGDNIEDLCLESSISHHTYLNSRSQASSPDQNSIMSLLNDRSFSSMSISSAHAEAPLTAEEMEYKSMASVVLWFGVISDVTRALTRCRPAILLPGSHGDAKVWTPVRQHAQAFAESCSPLRRMRVPISDDEVITILQCAFAYKTLVWATITKIQDALVHQMSETSLAEAVDAARKASNRYEEIFGQLVCLCQRDYMLLNPTTQMFYS